MKDGFNQLLFEVLVLGRGSLADRLSLPKDRAGRLGSRLLRGSVAGGPNLLTHGGSCWRNGPGALHGDAPEAVLGPGDGAGLFACGVPRVDDKGV